MRLFILLLIAILPVLPLQVRAGSDLSLQELQARCIIKPAEREKNPDASVNEGVFDQFLPSGLTKIIDVVNHGNEVTSARNNAGIIAYMRASVIGDSKFFPTAVRFLTKLREADEQRKKSSYALSPIEEFAEFDVYRLALDAAGGDKKVALKVLALYGHDNMYNGLAESAEKEDCRFLILDHLRPAPNSTLYLNGALGGLDPALKYTAADLHKAKGIARECERWFTAQPYDKIKDAKIKARSDAWPSCNDQHASYQADYYHVIVAAFLGCRASAKLTPVDHAAYLMMVRKYKLDRFREEVSGTHPVLEFGLDRLEKNIKPALPPLTELRRNADPIIARIGGEDYAIARAILNRYEFEVEFRLRQHEIGLKAGQAACREVKTGTCQ